MSAFAPDHPGAFVRPSPNFSARRGGLSVEMLLIHYTGMASGSAAEDRLCDPEAQVSAHYVVHEDGRIVQLVREVDRAWHAGKSLWRGVEDVNSWSVGVEIVNPGHGLGYSAFPRPQIRAVVELCRGVVSRHPIRPEMVLGHSDVAPGRKVDPGERFPWAWLNREGIGHYVRPSRACRGTSLAVGDAGADVAALQHALADYGYGLTVTGTYCDATRKVVDAFQRHYRPARVDGVADPATRTTLRRLLETRDG